MIKKLNSPEKNREDTYSKLIQRWARLPCGVGQEFWII